MKPAPFTYHRPRGLTDALALLDRLGPDAKLLSGGQSLGPMMNMRIARPAHLVDLNDLIELDYVRAGDGFVEIGALTRHHRLAKAPEIRRHLPLLAEAAGTIGHYAIRQRGTIGGSLAHADPAAQLPLVAVTLDAEIVLQASRGSRVVPARSFFQSVMTVDLQPDEMVIAVRFPRQPAGGRWAFEMFSQRAGDFSVASVALTLTRNGDDGIASLAFGLGGVAPVPQRVDAVEAAAPGAPLDEETASGLADLAASGVEPEDDERLPALYRRELVSALARRALARAFRDEEIAA